VEEARISDEMADVLKVVGALFAHRAELPCGEQVAQTLPRAMNDGSYRSIVADDGEGGCAAGARSDHISVAADGRRPPAGNRSAVVRDSRAR
jgi:hypothetical protein